MPVRPPVPVILEMPTGRPHNHWSIELERLGPWPGARGGSAAAASAQAATAQAPSPSLGPSLLSLAQSLRLRSAAAT
jgi:hypothetical protein